VYLHYEMRLTFDKILRVVQAACKNYNRASDHYRSKPLLYNPHESDRHGHAKVVYVPRIAPPRNKLELLVRCIEARCGVKSMENGRLAFKSFEMMLNRSCCTRTPATEICRRFRFSQAARRSCRLSSPSTRLGLARNSSIRLPCAIRTCRDPHNICGCSVSATVPTIALVLRACWVPTLALSTKQFSPR